MSTAEPTGPMQRCLLLAAVGGGLGYCRPGPGTWGSIAAAALGLVWILAAPAGWQQIGFGVAAVAAIVLGLCSCPVACRRFGRADPAQVVIDEIAGLWLGMALIPSVLLVASPVLAVVSALLCFRIFDICKPWPTQLLERLPGAFGVICDDLFAGVWAGLLTLPVLL